MSNDSPVLFFESRKSAQLAKRVHNSAQVRSKDVPLLQAFTDHRPSDDQQRRETRSNGTSSITPVCVCVCVCVLLFQGCLQFLCVYQGCGVFFFLII